MVSYNSTGSTEYGLLQWYRPQQSHLHRSGFQGFEIRTIQEGTICVTVFLTLQIICSNRQIVWLVIIRRVIGLIITWLVARILRNLVWLLRTIQTPINIKNWCNKIIFSIKVKVYEEHSSRYKPCHLFYLCCPVANNRGLLSISHDDHKCILTTSSIIIFKIFFWYHYVRSIVVPLSGTITRPWPDKPQSY